MTSKDGKNTLHYVKPKGFDVESVAEQIGEKDYVVATVAECIVQQQYWRNKALKNDTHENVYGNVSHNMLHGIHWRAPATLRKMKREKIIFCDDLYVVGSKSLGYRFSHSLFQDTDQVLDKWTLDLDSIHTNAAKSVREYKAKQEFDADDAFLSTYNKSIPALKVKDAVINHTKVTSDNVSSVSRAVNERKYFKQRGVSGRIYTHVTEVPKFVRPYFYTDEHENFSEVDLSSSQPFLFAGFVNSLLNHDIQAHENTSEKPHFASESLSGGCEVTESPAAILSKGCSITKPEHIQSWVSDLTDQEQDQLQQELQDFVEIVTEQDIYLDARDRSQPMYTKTLERDDMKTKVLILFNETHKNLNSDLYRSKTGAVYENRLKFLEASYQDSFPLLWGIMRKLRTYALARFQTSVGDLLNRLESYVMCYHVLRDVVETHDYPAYSIHDCIMVPTEIADDVDQKIKTTFNNLFGIEPSTTVEHLVIDES